MREIGLRVDGVEALSANLKTLSSRVSRGIMREAILEGAEPIRDRAAGLAPRAPGAPDLADHIVASPARTVDGIGVAVGPSSEQRGDRQRLSYGRQGLFVELGTANMSPQPFLRPAFDEMHQPALTKIGEALWRELSGRGLRRSMGSSAAPTIGGPGGSGLL